MFSVRKGQRLGISILFTLGFVFAGVVSAIPTSMVYADGESNHNQSSNNNDGNNSGQSNTNMTSDSNENATSDENSTNSNDRNQTVEKNSNITSEEHRQNETNSDDNSTNSDVRNNHGKNNANITSEEENHRENSTNSENENSTNTEHDSHHSMADQKREHYVSESAEQRHNEHLSSHAPITGPYLANMNYTLDAQGNATFVSNQTNQDNASLILNMSVWKSTHSLVAMDITGGSLHVGNNTISISSGHAYYLVNHPRLIIFGYVTQNSTSANATEHTVKLLKVFAVSMNDTKLPITSSDSLNVHILGPESKLASEWFVSMDGQVKLVP